MGESSFDVMAALSKKKTELEDQIKQAVKQTSPTAGMSPSEAEELLSALAPGPATEEDKKSFRAVFGPDLVDLPEEERHKLLLSGLRLLNPEPRGGEKGLREAACDAEKTLFLCRTPGGRERSAGVMGIAYLLFAARRRDTAKDPMACDLGDIPDTIASLRKRKDALPELGDAKTKKKNLIVFFVMLAAMAAVLFIPAIAGLFTEENVNNALMAIGVIATIVAFFIAGIGGSVAVLVGFALLVAILQFFLPLEFVGKILVLLVLGAIGFTSFRKYAKEAKKLSPVLRRRRADELAALRTDVDRCIRYIDGLEAQVDLYLKESTSNQNANATEKEKAAKEIAEERIRQYAEKLKKQRGELRRLLPSQ